MNFREEEIERRLRLGEDSHRGFRQVGFSGNRPVHPGRDDWADDIAAFANADGGVVLCGVTDAGEVQGMSREQIAALDRLLVETSTDCIRPAVLIRTQHRELDDRPFLLLEVPQGDTRHDSPDGSELRVRTVDNHGAFGTAGVSSRMTAKRDHANMQRRPVERAVPGSCGRVSNTTSTLMMMRASSMFRVCAAPAKTAPPFRAGPACRTHRQERHRESARSGFGLAVDDLAGNGLSSDYSRYL